MTSPQRLKLLIITHDVVDERMAGPAIRCWELARVLARTADVTLTSKFPVMRRPTDFAVACFGGEDVRLMAQAEAADVLLVQGLTLSAHPRLAGLGKYLVVDLYDPFVFESYGYFDAQGEGRDATYLEILGVMDHQMRVGDYFICANERQRDMWLGRFCALGRLTPELFASSPAMTSLLGIVPFGLPNEPPALVRPLLRGVVPGIGQADFVLVWGGGVWNWLDAPSVIQAVAELAPTRPQVKLCFMGLKHPNPEIPEMALAARSVALAAELGVTGTHVFFNHGWVDYDDRQSYLCEADAGISAHFDSIETRFSFRTRVLDYLWAGLPVLTTEGDGMAELVARERAGLVVPYGDVEGWKVAIARLIDDPAAARAMRDAARAASLRFHWSSVADPLAAYLRAPYHTAKCVGPTPTSPPRPATLVQKGFRVLANEGAGALVRKGLGYARKRQAALRAGSAEDEPGG